MEKKERLPFKEWLENTWYHYKWLIIFGAVCILFVSLSLTQCSQNEDIDVKLFHVGPMTISDAAAQQLKSTIADFAEDCNGDGEVHVDLLDITVNKFGNEEAGIDPVNFDHNNKAMQRFQVEVRAGKAYLYALDKEFFDICVEEGVLTPFSELFDETEMPENVIDGCGISISELDAYKLPGLSSVPDTAILCLRRSPENDDLSYGRTKEGWEGNKNTFVNIVKYKSE